MTDEERKAPAGWGVGLMTDEELIERLRWSHLYYEDAGENTAYTIEAPLEAADRLEAKNKRIAELEREKRQIIAWLRAVGSKADAQAIERGEHMR